MERSDEIAKLAAALAKAQGTIDDAEKDSVNPHYQSRYASLAAVRHSIKKPLSNNGLAYIQLPRANGRSIEIKTVLMHESGEFIANRAGSSTSDRLGHHLCTPIWPRLNPRPRL
jgi:hypothetical protein